MHYISTDRLTPGMALGQDIFDGAGCLLLAKHLLLNEEYISNLEFLGFPGVYIDDEFTQGAEIQQIITPEVKSHALKLVHDLFTFDENEPELSVREVKLRKTVENVVEDILKDGDVMFNMMDIRNYDDYIYYHSVNVGVLSAMVGARCGLDHDQLYQLTMSAMLHDIGKKFLPHPKDDAEWPPEGDEEKLWRKHPQLGADYLKNSYHFSPEVSQTIMLHHEPYNAGKELPLFARIIKMTDCYDVLVTKRPGKEPTPPSDALEYLMALAGIEFDPHLVNIFMRKVVVYPIGCELELSNGQHAVVVRNFPDFALRPMIKIIETGKEVNLRDDPDGRNITIRRIVM